MNSQNNIHDELKGLNSDLPSSTDKTPYSVPEGYFDGLAGSILAKVKGQEPSATEEIASLSPLLAGISRSMPYAVPYQYFKKSLEDLPVLMGKDPQSAILSLVERVTPYTVPVGYFANLPEQILERVAQPQAKVIPISRKEKTGTRWMVAAVTAGMILLSGYIYFTHKPDAGKALAQQVKNVSTRALDEFIKTTEITIGSNETAQATTAGNMEVKKLLSDVSDKELDAFLNQVSTDDEDLLLTN
jgi:hypothetical protein